MNREIKFRIYLGGKWLYWGFIDGSFVGLPMSTEEQLAMKELESRSQQYIGIKDTYGTDIFDGDIVKVHKFTQELGESLGVREGETELIAKIVFSPYGGTSIETKDGYSLFLWEDSDGWHEESLIVIGNLHEHPELLNS